MKHLTFKAVTTATDAGTFEAVISTATIDREKDIVDPNGMVRALQKWTSTGKNIPLAWNHSTKAEEQIGYIDPASAREAGGQVIANGWIDQSIPAGEHAWRLVKAGTLGFSFGYLTVAGAPRKGGGVHIKELDVFEVTATPTPMNNDTRVLGWKAMGQDMQARMLSSMLGQAREFIDSEPDEQDVTKMQQIADLLAQLGAEEASEPPEDAEDASKAATSSPSVPADTPKAVDETDKAPVRTRSVDPLRAQARRTILEIQSDGLSQKPPRKAVIEPSPEPVDLVALRDESRRLMVQILSGGIQDS